MELIINKNETKNVVLLNSTEEQIRIVQNEESSICVHFIDLFPQAVHVSRNVMVEQVGKNSKVQLFAMGYLQQNQQINFVSNVLHNCPWGHSEQLLKYVLTDTASFSFLGKVYVAPNAQKIVAQQTNKNILLSPQTKVQTQPQLEIYADDVQASHGASTGAFDENMLFYFLQRGIARPEAEKMLIRAFYHEIISSLPTEYQTEIEKEFATHQW